MREERELSIKAEIIDKMAALITAAFGLIAALAWNEAIKNAIDQLGLTQFGPWLYAIIVTILAVVMTIWIARVASKIKQ
ncbi:MAG: DUF5654 family protein [Candidatus Thermoplasmatota archaeon]